MLASSSVCRFLSVFSCSLLLAFVCGLMGCSHGEFSLNSCNVNNPCQNNGVCFDLDQDYICRCVDDYYGKNCEKPPVPGGRPFKLKLYFDDKGKPSYSFIIYTSEGFSYNYHVDCDSDGTLEASNLTGKYECVYSQAGDYMVSITGDYPAPNFSDPNISSSSPDEYVLTTNDRNNCYSLIEVLDWGTQHWKGMRGAFAECMNLVSTGRTTPNFSAVKDMSFMFRSARLFDSVALHWDVSNVTNMFSMFDEARVFNQPLNSWKVSNVTNMNFMFYDTRAFNQPLNNWDVSNVTNMFSMFGEAIAFNQPLDNWDVSNVTNMAGLFAGASMFNQPLDNWDVSNVTNMAGVFANASVFNQPLNNWNVSNVTNMWLMFAGASVFNQPLNNWDVSNVTNMDDIFKDATSFNQNLSTWKTGNLTRCGGFDVGATKWQDDYKFSHLNCTK